MIGLIIAVIVLACVLCVVTLVQILYTESLRLRKRDLLHSDIQGNRIFIVDLALYNQALAKATAEKEALATPAK